MKVKDKYSKKTDRAWMNVYARLEKEGLMTDRVSGPPLRSGIRKWGPAAAAVVLFCLVLSVAYQFNKTDKTERFFLTQQNQEINSSLVTTLEDGSIVYLSGNTSLQYPEHFAPEKREVSLQGNALFDVAGNRVRPFLIETEEVRIEVIGTAFQVKSSDQSPFELSVQRGEVKVTLKQNGADVHVKAGETVTLHSKQLQLSQTPDPEQFARYTRRIRFKDEKLGNILHVINLKTSGVRIKTVPALENRTLTVTFSENNTPEMMVELICRALKTHSKMENNVITISE